MSGKLKAKQAALRAELHARINAARDFINLNGSARAVGRLPYVFGFADYLSLAAYGQTDGLARYIAAYELSAEERQMLAQWLAALHHDERGRPDGRMQRGIDLAERRVVAAVVQARREWCKQHGRKRCPADELAPIIDAKIDAERRASGVQVEPARVLAGLKEKKSRR